MSIFRAIIKFFTVLGLETVIYGIIWHKPEGSTVRPAVISAICVALLFALAEALNP